MKKLLCLLLLLASANAFAQSADSLLTRRPRFYTGLTVSPQMLFLGIFDFGLYGNVEYLPFKKNNLALYAGVDVRNKWFQIPMHQIGLNTQDLNTKYSVNVLFPVGVGYCFPSKKKKKSENFFLLATPYYFAWKDNVKNQYMNNTVSNDAFSVMYGVCWSSTKVSKKGRVFNSQVYVPLFSRNFLEVARNMNIKFGISLNK